MIMIVVDLVNILKIIMRECQREKYVSVSTKVTTILENSLLLIGTRSESRQCQNLI